MSLITPSVDFCNLKVSDRMLIDSMELNAEEAAKMVKLFLDQEICWDSLDYNNEGKLKLYTIFAKGNKMTLSSFFANYDVNMRAKDVDGNNPLHYLAKNRNDGIAECFINASLDVFDVHACNGKNETALHIAALHGNPEIVQFLLERGADVNAAAIDGRTPLHYVVKIELPMDNRVKCVSLLMLHGADAGIIVDGDSILDDMMFCTPDNDDDYDFSLETMINSNPLDLLNPVLAQLVIDEAICKPIHEHIRMMIEMFSSDQFFNLKALYLQFKTELHKTQLHVIYENETLYEILTNEKSVAKMVQYAQNLEELLKIQEECCKFELIPYYQDFILKKRFDDAIKLVHSRG